MSRRRVQVTFVDYLHPVSVHNPLGGSSDQTCGPVWQTQDQSSESLPLRPVSAQHYEWQQISVSYSQTLEKFVCFTATQNLMWTNLVGSTWSTLNFEWQYICLLCISVYPHTSLCPSEARICLPTHISVGF